MKTCCGNKLHDGECRQWCAVDAPVDTMEQRKAAALEDIKLLWEKIPLEARDEFKGQLLQPSPPVDGSEVDDEDIYFCNEIADGLEKNNQLSAALHLRNVIRAAQHPQREEWIDISTAPMDGTRVLVAIHEWNKPQNKLIVVEAFYDHGWVCMEDDGSRAQCYEPVKWQKLPSPPKAEK